MPIIGSSASPKGVPSVPTIGTATAGNASASVTFTAPSFSKLPITSYTVTASPGGATGTGASSPITVSGLTNGTAYTFTVRATHANGTSAASASSNSATPVVPIAVTGGTLASDATYFYKTFVDSGDLSVTGFSSGLTADILVIGSGGTSGTNNSGAGGGGAGGVAYYPNQSLSNGSYTITVGAGASGYQTHGYNSQFGSLTAAVGGGQGSNYGPGSAGGSGGGAAYNPGGGNGGYSGGAGTAGQGNDGGRSRWTGNQTWGGHGGGGGAGAVGTNGDFGIGPVGNEGEPGSEGGPGLQTAGNGGNGTSAYSSWGAATGTGVNVSGTYWYAGGGAGCGRSHSSGGFSGLGSWGSCPHNGGGGAGGPAATGAGSPYGYYPSGSGVVIVRWTKSQGGA